MVFGWLIEVDNFENKEFCVEFGECVDMCIWII